MKAMPIDNFDEFSSLYDLEKYRMGCGRNWEKVNINNPDLIKEIQDKIRDFLPTWRTYNHYTYVRNRFIDFLTIEYYIWSMDGYEWYDHLFDYIRGKDRKQMFIDCNLEYWYLIKWIKGDMDMSFYKMEQALDIYPQTNLELERIYLHLLGFTQL